MVKNKIKFEILFLFLLLIVIVGCAQQDGKSSREETITGTDGLTIEFLEGYPQDRYIVSGSAEPISVMLDVRNKGTFPKENEQNILGFGQIYLSGFDNRIIAMEQVKSLSGLNLPAATSLYPEGGFDTVRFNGYMNIGYLEVDRYEPTIQATICYPYSTRLGTSVCIDPFPYDETQEKVCEMGTYTFSSQGAPVAVTRIEQEASTNKIQFKITIKNVGDGDIISLGKLAACNPLYGAALERDDFDKVALASVTLGSVPILGSCGPFAEGSGNIIKLYKGEGYVICSVDIAYFGGPGSAYTTPLNIELQYGYRSTISKQIKISKFTS